VRGLRRSTITGVAVVLISGCPAEVDDAPPAENDTELAVCLQGEPFVAQGRVPVQDPGEGDATRISAIRWEEHEGCERLVIDLAVENGVPAAGAGAVSAEVLRDLGLVRVQLREVEWVEPESTEERIGGRLAHAAYAVWSPDGRWTFVDVHLASEAEAHVTVLGEPARVIVDLRPGGGAVPEPAPTEQRVVVLEPRPGTASYPLTVIGYARTFEANVVARIEQDGEEVAEDFTTATAWVDAWGHFELTFDEGPTGPIVLHVGEYSARDGTWEGVAIELQMESP
jgi:hypothetical protein